MTASQHAGATSHETTEWQALNWQAMTRTVRRLQARIVQAIQARRWGKVKALQHLLTHSFSAKALAVRRVTENPGKHTPGVDRVIWNTPEKKAAAIDTLRQRGYRAQPMRRVLIPKPNGKMRPLGISTMRDRAMQALYLFALDPIAETTGDPNSYGFRPQRCTADAIEQCQLILSRKTSAQWVLEADIQSCFDEISHEWLEAHIPMDKAILRQWLKAGIMTKGAWQPTDAGTPQGNIASPVLCNLTLNGLEQVLKGNHLSSRLRRTGLINLVRWADDFIITGRTPEVLTQEVKPLVEEFLQERGLRLAPEKTRITHIAEGFDFLGKRIRKYKGKFLAIPSKKNTHAVLEKIREIVRSHKQATAGHLIVQLNPIIRGWADYHRHSASKRTMHKVDNAIYHAVWRWAKRRHPHKSRRWIARKYYTTRGNRHWVFHGSTVDASGKVRVQYLHQAADTPIRRHTKIKAAANPYDPAWEVYFEERLGVQMEANLRGRRRLLYLWQAQQGLCPVCQQKITKLTGWHNHHIVQRSLGGSDHADNRVLLHPTCHRHVHSQGVPVEKLRPATGVGKA